jgi:DNA-binding transcriptional ArsR family regulator
VHDVSLTGDTKFGHPLCKRRNGRSEVHFGILFIPEAWPLKRQNVTVAAEASKPTSCLLLANSLGHPNMASNARFAEIATLAGDPSRAAILHALMDGRALTASELARVAGITPQTVSGHLARMVEAGLLAIKRQGRHRYHRLASPTVAQMIESIMQVASVGVPSPKRIFVGPRNAAIRRARTCYDHIAGRLGVALADAMVAAGYAELSNEAGLITRSGLAFLSHIGLDVEAMQTNNARRSNRLLCRPCLDWSERRIHLAGRVGAALCAQSLAKDLVRRVDGSRALLVTPKGLRIYREQFGVRLDEPIRSPSRPTPATTSP